MALHPTIIEVDGVDDLGEVLEAMHAIAATGAGWLNLQPEVPPEQQPPPASALTQLIRRNSPDAALGTWTPADPAQPDAFQHVGVQHHLGNRLLPLLDTMGLTRPDGWRRVQDSPRRGLVMAAPHDESAEVILRWLLDLTVAATTLQTAGRWRVSVHQSRTR